MAIQNAGCVSAYFCGGHTTSIFGYNFVAPLKITQ